MDLLRPVTQRPIGAFAAAGFALLLVVVAGSGTVRANLEHRIVRLEDQVSARRGELELARMQLRRLDTIVRQSARYRIPADLAAIIHDVAAEEGIEPDLAFSLVHVESQFTRRAVSSAGAVGLTQVMPSTATWLDPSVLEGDLFDSETNLRLGFRYLRKMIEQYEGNIDLALLAYNRGPTRVDSILRAGGDPSNGYSHAVLEGR